MCVGRSIHSDQVIKRFIGCSRGHRRDKWLRLRTGIVVLVERHRCHYGISLYAVEYALHG